MTVQRVGKPRSNAPRVSTLYDAFCKPWGLYIENLRGDRQVYRLASDQGVSGKANYTASFNSHTGVHENRHNMAELQRRQPTLFHAYAQWVNNANNVERSFFTKDGVSYCYETGEPEDPQLEPKDDRQGFKGVIPTGAGWEYAKTVTDEEGSDWLLYRRSVNNALWQIKLVSIDPQPKKANFLFGYNHKMSRYTGDKDRKILEMYKRDLWDQCQQYVGSAAVKDKT